MISRMKPHPQPEQDAPRPKPNCFWSQSKTTSSINNLNKPVRQPPCLYTFLSFVVFDYINVKTTDLLHMKNLAIKTRIIDKEGIK